MSDLGDNLKPDSTFFNYLQCPICIEFFSVPIFQCDSGHSICSTCASKSPKCPSCRDNIGKKLRNYPLEQQLSAIEYHCRFLGCNACMKLSDRVLHEEHCPYNPNIECLIQNCRWEGHRDGILQHLITRHRIPHYDIFGDSAEYSSRLRSSALPSSAGCVKLLHTFDIGGQKTTILTYIFMDAGRNLFFPQFRTLQEVPARYTLKIWNTEVTAEELVLVGRAPTVAMSLEEERDQKRCYVLDLESMINLFAFQDHNEEGHKLLHYKLTIG